MKTITKILIVLSIAVFSSCEGPIGPPGRDGVDGQDGFDGTSLLGTIFEKTVDFTEENGFEAFFVFPNDFEIYSTDIVMVYLLWEEVQTDNGVLDVWRPLPQTILLDEGLIQYNFDYTVEDVKIFIEETVGGLLPAETENQTFRIAVIPADSYENKSLEINSINSVMESLNIDSNSIIKIPVK
ncbi:hypothetical protein ACUNWD_12475 [Sunxiuqinia sp. A32]|uniref:hypothetical protein n=1 Tax=Sunxiuqinia sp. A32 TaxID=3461496 RepID=UPI004045A37E